MSHKPSRVFLDTNVYIIGAADENSPEAAILRWAGYGQAQPGVVEIIVSQELFEQILRVGRRLQGKDWGSEILGHIWTELTLRYVLIQEAERSEIEAIRVIPREDIGVYLAARNGQAECFVSSNRELIAALAQKTGEFECLTAEMFVEQYLK
jgi:hypothetical protein